MDLDRTQERPLSAREEKRLAELEQVIRDNFRGFVAVGQALAEIRESRLYRETHSLFEDYCRDLWDMSHQRAFQLEAAAKVIDNLATIVATSNDGAEVEILPTNEAQARELTRLQPEEQVKVWSGLVQEAKAQSFGNKAQVKITAQAVKKAVLGYKGKELGVAINRTNREARKNQTDYASEDFTQAFNAFLTQVDIERNAGWRYTSRKTCHKHIMTIAELLAEAGPAALETGCAMELSDREKLRDGGFRIFRMNPKAILIEEWLRADQWAAHTEHESPAAMSEAFKELMKDHRNLRG